MLLAAAAWLASPGMSVAVVVYGAAHASGRIHRQFASATCARRYAVLSAIAITWIVVLAYSAAVLPSNLGAVFT